ncbi:CopG family ribbon-helix-helix protein [Candidatus Thorarchaeota archaeon]|nr:MAG: CopG family ribbon-helix-helix protein [Candidatus Thorarchaeota archaeon]
MPIVAVSMSESDFEELENLRNEGKFSNRSEVVRHAVQSLLSEYHSLEHAEGTITAVITALYYKKGHGHTISAVQHEFREHITATVHAHTNEGNCTEVMIIKADAELVRDFVKKLRSQKKVLRAFWNIVGG